MLVTSRFVARISPARAIALEALEAVAKGSYASDTLRELSASLTVRDAGLAAQIVFGCLRFQKQLDFLIEMYSGRRAPKLDHPVLLSLRAAIFQLRYLERVPAHAAVHDAVEWVKARARSAAGFVNAVLRKVNREPVSWPDLATELSIPEWMLERWTAHFGAEQARKIADAALREPERYVRIAGKPRLQAETPAPHGRLQDISSQAVVPLLSLEPGNAYLDLCAAPGNKTLQAFETPLSLAVACDVSLARLREIPPVCHRVVLDAAAPLPFGRTFDRILIDAPCSGSGTLARNPEIKWRVKIEDFGRFGEKQLRIAEQAVNWLAPGGVLVYATCSLESEENEAVVRKLLAGHPQFRCEREMWRLPGRDEGDGFYAAVLRRA